MKTEIILSKAGGGEAIYWDFRFCLADQDGISSPSVIVSPHLTWSIGSAILSRNQFYYRPFDINEKFLQHSTNINVIMK